MAANAPLKNRTPAPEPEWIDDTGRLRALVDELVERDVYGLDTEFHRERTYWPNLALLQLSWDGGIALVDPFATDVSVLEPLMAGPGTAIVHAAEQDLEVLERACGKGPSRLFDTQVAAGFVGFASPSLSTLSERLVGVRLPKGDRLTDWTARPLTAAQRTYAASDVAHLLDLHRILLEKLDKRGRRSWAEEECELLRVRDRTPQDPDTAWWRLKDSRGLRGPSRGVAQALAGWRERRAAHLDLPPRFVLSDLAVLGIAHRRPQTRAELESVRGLDGRQLKGNAADDLLQVIQDGAALDPDAIKSPPTDDLERTLRPAITLVSAWVAQLGRDLDVDPALLGTRSDVQSLLRGEPDARLALGWRAGLVGVPVRQLVKGEAALAFDGDDLVLEARSRQPVEIDPAIPLGD